MKAVAHRPKDLEDIRTIADKYRLSWSCRGVPPVLAVVALPPSSSTTAGETFTAIPKEPKYPDLDVKRIEGWVQAFGEILETPELWDAVKTLLK